MGRLDGCVRVGGCGGGCACAWGSKNGPAQPLTNGDCSRGSRTAECRRRWWSVVGGGGRS